MNMWAGFGGALGGLFISNQFIDGLKDLSKIGSEFSAVQNQLKESLGYTSIELNNQADALSKNNLIGEKDILTVQQRLALYTDDEKQIKKLTPAILDYAQATGKTLLEATQVVTRAIESEKGSIKGFPGHLDGAAESSERLSSVMEILEKHFHGQAEAVRESKTIFDDLSFSLANLKKFEAINLFGKDNEKELLKYQQELHEVLEGNVDANDIYWQGYLETIKTYEDKITEEKKKALKQQEEDAAESAIKTLNLTPGYSTQKGGQKEMQDAAKKAAEDAKRMADEIEREREQINTRGAEWRLKQLEVVHKEEEDYDKKATESCKKMQDEQNHYVEEKAKNAMKLDKQLLDEKKSGYAQEVEAINEKYDEMEKAGANHEMAEEARERALKSLKIESYSSWAQSALGNMAIIAQATKADANTQKGIAMVEAAINTAVGATKALSATPWPPVNIGLMALTIAAGLAEESKIASQSFAGGTQSAPGGWATVGEEGPEKMYVPRGAQIKTAAQSRQMDASANNNKTINLHFHTYDQSGQLTETLTREIRSGTANVDRFISTFMGKAGNFLNL
ncbi:MAG: hypothetical protein WBM07_18165 [Chitinivibrionales bacterium]